MYKSRRDFLKKVAVMAAAASVTNANASAIKKAFSINADKGTSFYDAEHIVFLMQENRSFDHIFGCMKGVRGFNDPRAKWLPDGNKVWIQKNKENKAYAPFHLDIHKTKITWQGGLPHDWPDQLGARNGGKYDKWLPFKSEMCLGYYNRNDMPFYYAMADAFTVCDHYFCSSLTGTTPNRLFFWTGNIRPKPDGNSKPAVRNFMAESRDNTYVDWSTFPELLEDFEIDWKIYQNELWTAELPDKTDYWLGNYGDNAIEYVKRHNVRLSKYFRKNGDAGNKKGAPALSAEKVTALYNQLSPKQKNLVDKAFTTNIDQSDYLELEPFTFTNDEGIEQTVDIPRGDIFHQFRKDVESNQLPTVSWLAAPQSFSDHTSSPFYGTWYVSQVLDILTQNPEVWKKTIFIVNYDENDGYYDHLPPFVVPGGTIDGKVSKGIDTASDFDTERQQSIGLGYRVPMIIASPWSKGGFVNSEISDHTSTLMFLEHFLQKKTGRKIYSPHISSWRRAVCSNLTSAFRPYNGESFPLPDFLKVKEVVTNIQNAKNKPAQVVPDELSATDINAINSSNTSSVLPVQEKGTKPACALPYRLQANCHLNKETKKLALNFSVESMPGAKGAPFNMYTRSSYNKDKGKTWAYAVLAGDTITDELDLSKFDDNRYQLCIDGPNGFSRQYSGDENDPELEVNFEYGGKKILSHKTTEKVVLTLHNKGREDLEISITDLAYNMKDVTLHIPGLKSKQLNISLEKSSGWYQFMLKVKGYALFEKLYAGHVETGNTSITDPHMGGVM